MTTIAKLFLNHSSPLMKVSKVLGEWELRKVIILGDNEQECLCGNKVSEFCTLWNQKTFKEIVLEESCVKELLKKNSLQNLEVAKFPIILQIFKQILKNPAFSASWEVIEYAEKMEMFTKEEVREYQGILATPIPSEEQQKRLLFLNAKLLSKYQHKPQPKIQNNRVPLSQ